MTANLSATQKEHFIEMAETSLNDLCTIRVFQSRTKSSYADLSNTYIDVERVPCGISFVVNKFKAQLGIAAISQADAVLRLSLEQEIKEADLVICKDHTFSIDGITPGLTLQLITLKFYSSEE